MYEVSANIKNSKFKIKLEYYNNKNGFEDSP